MEKLKERMRRDRIKRKQEEREVEEQLKEKKNRRSGKTIQIKYVNAPTIKTGRNYCIWPIYQGSLFKDQSDMQIKCKE